MKTWTIDELQALDRKYAIADIPRHQHPLQAAAEILAVEPLAALHRKTEIDQIVRDYVSMNRPDFRGDYLV